MRCDCEECGGTGEVPCGGCDGTGRVNRGILGIDIKAIWRLSEAQTDELLALQEDGLRCQDQAIRLKQLNPKAAASYDRQLTETLETIDRQANEILES